MHENILFIDTESDFDTKEPISVQWVFNDSKGIIKDFKLNNGYDLLKKMWNDADGVILFSAPYDMGVLSALWTNTYKWVSYGEKDNKSSYWLMRLFGHTYKVKKIGFTRNFISPYTDEYTPIIDLLKLWEILIEQEDISLKSLIKRHLNIIPIERTKETIHLEAYQYQDVLCPKKLWSIFLDKIKDIEELKDFTLKDWGDIKSPATFTKKFYEKAYPDLKEWRDNENNGAYKQYNIEGCFEDAYHGGLTISFYRGNLKNVGVLDIHGAYVKAIEVLNTDKYLKFDIEKIDSFNFKKPFLLKVKSNFILKNINHGLKLFYVKQKHINWIWNFDVAAINNLIDDYKYDVLESYKIISLLNIDESLPVQWSRMKDDEEKENGKTTRYQYYKFCGNTSYGIKAQRKPFKTIHTNMVIAGMITSKVHEVLTGIIKVLKEHGCINRYNDTDSSFFTFGDKYKTVEDFKLLESKINEFIKPFSVGYEGLFEDAKILSLKRYVCTPTEKHQIINDKLMGEGKVKSKIKLHGKGRYDISQGDILEYALTNYLKNDEFLNIKQFSANTLLGMKMVLDRSFGEIKHNHPFMFKKDVLSDKMKSDFMYKWYWHIDTKTTYDINKKEFERKFRRFQNILDAEIFFKNIQGELSSDDLLETDFSNWDSDIQTDFLDSEEVANSWSNNIGNNETKNKLQINAQIKPVKKIIKTHYCRKCGVLLNPDWVDKISNNIRLSAYKKRNYLCNECRKKTR